MLQITRSCLPCLHEYTKTIKASESVESSFVVSGQGKTKMAFSPTIQLLRGGEQTPVNINQVEYNCYEIIDQEKNRIAELRIESAEAQSSGKVYKVILTPKAHNLELISFGLVGCGFIEGATGQLTNGDFSFSGSGFIKLGDYPSENDIEKSLYDLGVADQESRPGQYFSSEYAAIGGTQETFWVGAVQPRKLWPSITSGFIGPREEQKIRISIRAGLPQEKITLAPDEPVETKWFIGAGKWSNLEQEYGNCTAAYNGQRPYTFMSGINLWNRYFDRNSHGIYLSNMKNFQRLKSEGHLPKNEGQADIFWIDDGYQPQGNVWGDYRFSGRLFPSGIKDFVKEATKNNLITGLWMPIALAQRGAPILRERPELFCRTPIHRRLQCKTFHLFDLRTPAAHAHISKLVKTAKQQGFKALKLDFLHYILTHNWFPKTSLEIYQSLLNTVRDAAGDDMFILACGAPVLPSLTKSSTGRALVDGVRAGTDIAVVCGGAGSEDLYAQLQFMAARSPLRNATILDGDGVITQGLPKKHSKLAVAKTLGGRSWTTSDDLCQELTWKGKLDHRQLSSVFAPLNPFEREYNETLQPISNINRFANWGRIEKKFPVPVNWVNTENGDRIFLNLSSKQVLSRQKIVPPHSIAYV